MNDEVFEALKTVIKLAQWETNRRRFGKKTLQEAVNKVDGWVHEVIKEHSKI